VEETMERGARIWLPYISLRIKAARSHLPALRFRYIEENVTSDPTSTAMYANGTASLIQSTSSNIFEQRTLPWDKDLIPMLCDLGKKGSD
jgi:hypothetical protein